MAFFHGFEEFGREPMVIPCDNDGFLGVYQKCNSTCEHAWTVAKALNTLVDRLGTQLLVSDTRRMSGLGERMADRISRGKVAEAWSMGYMHLEQQRLPTVLLRWIRDPIRKVDLGHEILEELSCWRVLPPLLV